MPEAGSPPTTPRRSWLSNLLWFAIGIAAICFVAYEIAQPGDPVFSGKASSQKPPESPFSKTAFAFGNAINTNDVGAMRKLLEDGANPNIVYLNGTTVLDCAACMGRTECVRLLLDHGANPNVLSSTGNALHSVTMYSTDYPDIVRLLLEDGVDIRAKDSEGNTALDNARKNKLKKSIALIENAMKSNGIPIPSQEPPKELSTVSGVSIRFLGPGRQSAVGSVSVCGPDQKNICELKAEARSLFDILGTLSPFGLRMRDEAPLPEGFYDISAQVKGDREALWKLVVSAYEQAFGVRVSRKKREMQAYVLTCQSSKPVGLKLSADKTSWGDNGRKYRKFSMDEFAIELEGKLRTPVVNETRLKGRYDFEMAGSFYHPEAVIESVNKLGLKLQLAKRTVDIIVVEQAPHPPEPKP
jgi:hypothetical protein